MQHRGTAVRPRYGRIAALASSVTVTLVAALAGVGVLGAGAGVPPTAAARNAAYGTAPKADLAAGADAGSGTTSPPSHSSDTSGSQGSQVYSPGLQTSNQAALTALPASSGEGRRVVFSQHLQRVWLVSTKDRVLRTYLVSGSTTGNLQPGTYSVYSRSRHAIGIDDSGTMEFFVRFTQGPTGAAIGFHSIPTKDGHLIQTTAQLGTAQSHGCIRQWRPDAIAMWAFAPDDTSVVVVA